eukprot:626069-Pelagomonas_calceolata.AAC.6
MEGLYPTCWRLRSSIPHITAGPNSTSSPANFPPLPEHFPGVSHMHGKEEKFARANTVVLKQACSSTMGAPGLACALLILLNALSYKGLFYSPRL